MIIAFLLFFIPPLLFTSRGYASAAKAHNVVHPIECNQSVIFSTLQFHKNIAEPASSCIVEDIVDKGNRQSRPSFHCPQQGVKCRKKRKKRETKRVWMCVDPSIHHNTWKRSFALGSSDWLSYSTTTPCPVFFTVIPTTPWTFFSFSFPLFLTYRWAHP